MPWVPVSGCLISGSVCIEAQNFPVRATPPLSAPRPAQHVGAAHPHETMAAEWVTKYQLGKTNDVLYPNFDPFCFSILADWGEAPDVIAFAGRRGLAWHGG